MRIGGVDPAVIRELSGIYKPFVKAFKELISNAYDADAELVTIRLTDDYTSLEISDNGRGLTPFEFRNDFTKIGGSYTRLREEFTALGRPKIGSKGIGFLAVARYCSEMVVVSSTTRPYHGKAECRPKRGKIDLLSLLEVPLTRDLLPGRLKINSVAYISDRGPKKLTAKQYTHVGDGVIQLIPEYSGSTLEVEYTVDCRAIEVRGTFDFDYLLSLENQKDLEAIEDFCDLEVSSLPEGDSRINESFTRIMLRGLKDFVVRDLRMPQKKGFVRNVESQSGLERFTWHLRRCIPARYEMPANIRDAFGKNNLDSEAIKYINKIILTSPMDAGSELTRPVWGGNDSNRSGPIAKDISAEVTINSGGLIACGYILGSTEIINPAEYRGIAVRVRNVQIGSPTFFGFENIATGAMKAALSQVTGEINVLKGMDAIDSLNPGRESFYEENLHFKALRSHIVGEGETVGGLLGKVITGILTRSKVMSTAFDLISKADQRRRALLSVSSAINYYSDGPGDGESLRKLFQETVVTANGLLELPEHDVRPAKKLLGYHIEARQGLIEGMLTDPSVGKIYFDFDHDRWSWRIFVLGHTYNVVPKLGTENHPLCQLDTTSRTIYINWSHPLRQQMGDAAFIKSSMALTVASHACQGQPDSMMGLALKLLIFREI